MEQLLTEEFLRRLKALHGRGTLPGNSLQYPFPTPQPGLPPPQTPSPGSHAFTNLILELHGFWKSKVYEVHSSWKEVTGEIDIKGLERENPSADKRFASYEMPKFKLGNRVKIVAMDKRLFKILHKKVGIWKESLFELVGKEAIVMNLSSQYVIGVASIDNGGIWHVHGFALEIIDDGKEEGLWQNRTDFNRGDEVVIGVDNAVLSNLQINSKKTPIEIAEQLHGFIGRVMCVFSNEVAVTFDEMNHELFHPAALELYSGKKSRTTKKTRSKAQNFQEMRKGTRVTVIEDLLEIWTLQRGHGEWQYTMTKYLGKEGTIVDNLPNGDVVVKFSAFESFRMNREAVVDRKTKHTSKSKKKTRPVIPIPFKVGDIVRLHLLPVDLLSNLQLLRIPNTFIPIIGGCMKFIGYKDLLNGVVDFGDGTHFFINIWLLTKVGVAVSKEHKDIFKKDEEIGVGEKGMLWAGPKNFAKGVLKEMRGGFEKALSESGTILGYEQNGNVVMQYSDGKKYSIPDEFVCSERDLWLNQIEEQSTYIDWSKEKNPLRTVSHVEAAILHSVTEVLRENDEKTALGWSSTIETLDPPELKLMTLVTPGPIKDRDKFEEKLKSKLLMEKLDCGFENRDIMISAPGEGYLVKIKCGDKDTCDSPTKEEFPQFVRKDEFTRSSSIHEGFSESSQLLNASVPTTHGTNAYSLSIPPGVQQVNLILNNQANSQVPAVPHPHPASQTSDIATAPRTYQVPQHIINMNASGGNTIIIDNSYVRSVDTNQNADDQSQQ